MALALVQHLGSIFLLHFIGFLYVAGYRVYMSQFMGGGQMTLAGVSTLPSLCVTGCPEWE